MVATRAGAPAPGVTRSPESVSEGSERLRPQHLGAGDQTPGQ